jgi:glyoxylase-like metal-dependent hydrolase (beta-lactamase superfamily II)
MFVEAVVVGPLQENSYVLACEDTKEAVIFDPGAEADRILQIVTSHGFSVKYVLNTHGHPDHVGAVADVVEQTEAPFLLHADDVYLIKGFDSDPIRAFLSARIPPKPDRFLQDGEIIAVGSLSVKVLHTPGHTPGGVCFLVENILFSGDTLFANSIGRTDLPGGNYQQLLTSIHQRLLPLDGKTIVYSGHGQPTSIEHEQQYNPFL